MAYYSRSARKLAKQSRTRLIWTIIILLILGYASIFWILPTFIGGIGILNGIIHPSVNKEKPLDITLAPPQISIPYEATNSANIDIKGYSKGKQVKIYLNDKLEQTADVDSEGNFLAANIELAFGSNNIYGKSVDDKNQESLASKTIKIVYDDSKPNLEVTNPPDNAEIKSERKLNVSGKVDLDDYVYVNGAQAIVQQDGSFNYQISLNDGSNQ